MDRGAVYDDGLLFYNTLFDENAASHIALGSAYEFTTGEQDHDRLNRSSIHIDFMIGSDDVSVTAEQLLDFLRREPPSLDAGERDRADRPCG